MSAVDVLAVIQSVRELRASAPDSYPAPVAAEINGAVVEARTVYNSNTHGSRTLYRMDGRAIAFARLLMALRSKGAA